jgi:AraC-like DNA-binding protein
MALNLARELLETTELPVDQVARDCGLGSAANLRLHFRRALDTTPTVYRRTFTRRSPSLTHEAGAPAPPEHTRARVITAWQDP